MASRNMGTTAADELARALARLLGVDYCDILRRKLVQVLSPDEVIQASKAGESIYSSIHIAIAHRPIAMPS